MIYQPSNLLQDPSLLEELQRIAQAFELLRAAPSMPQREREYPRPFDGQFAIADGTNWDPLGDAVKKPVWYDKETQTWNNFGEGTGGALVHAVVGTLNQISVNNTDPQNPVLSLAAAVLASLALANSAVQPASLDPFYKFQEDADKSWILSDFLKGHTIIGVRTSPAIVRIPATLPVERLVSIKDETGLGGVSVVTY